MRLPQFFCTALILLFSFSAFSAEYEVIEIEDPPIRDWAFNRKHGVSIAQYADTVHASGPGTDMELLTLPIEATTIDAQYDGDLFAVVTSDGFINVYSIMDMALQANFQIAGVSKVRFSESNEYLFAVVPDASRLVRIDLATGVLGEATLDGITPVDLAAWDGELIALQQIADSNPNTLGVIIHRTWPPVEGSPLSSISTEAPKPAGRTLHFFGDGNRLFVGRGSNPIMVHDFAEGVDLPLWNISGPSRQGAMFTGINNAETTLYFYSALYTMSRFNLVSHTRESIRLPNQYGGQAGIHHLLGDGEHTIAHFPRHSLSLYNLVRETMQGSSRMRHVPGADFQFHPDGDRIIAGSPPAIYSFPDFEVLDGPNFPPEVPRFRGFFDRDTVYTRLGMEFRLLPLNDDSGTSLVLPIGIPVDPVFEPHLRADFHLEAGMIVYHTPKVLTYSQSLRRDLESFVGVESLDRKLPNSGVSPSTAHKGAPDYYTHDIAAKGFDRRSGNQYFLVNHHTNIAVLFLTTNTFELLTYDALTATPQRLVISVNREYGNFLYPRFAWFAVYRETERDFLYTQSGGVGLQNLYSLDPETHETEFLRTIPKEPVAYTTVQHWQTGFFFSRQNTGILILDPMLGRSHRLLPNTSLSEMHLSPDGRHLMASAPGRYYIVDLSQRSLYVGTALDRLLGRATHLPPDINRDSIIDASDLLHTFGTVGDSLNGN